MGNSKITVQKDSIILEVGGVKAILNSSGLTIIGGEIKAKYKFIIFRKR